jgi:hypothetical protein
MVSFDNELFMFVNWNSILLKIMCIVEWLEIGLGCGYP